MEDITVYQLWALLSPILIAPIVHLYRVSNSNTDTINNLKVEVAMMRSEQENLEKTLNYLIEPLRQSIENQNKTLQELHTLVTVLDKKVTVVESKVVRTTD